MSRRTYSESSDEEEAGHSRKRRRHSDTLDIEERLESLITRVGERSTSSLESNLEGLASVLEADLANYKTKILKILCDCVTNMPHRMTVYTTLVGLFNTKNYNAGGDFVEALVRLLKEALKSGSYHTARLVMRFLSDLVNCRVIMVSSLLTLYDSFLDVTLEDGIPQARSDWYVYAVLSCLPWVGQELHQKKEQDLERILNMIENYLKKRQKIHMTALRVWSADEGLPQEEYLDCLWNQIQNLKRNKWEESELVRPYVAFDGTLCDALQHSIPKIMLPSHNEDAASYPLPSVVFRMFDYSDIPDSVAPLPGQYSMERFIVEEQLHWTLNNHHLERKDCAGALLEPSFKFKIPLNYMIVEVVFAQLFQLPRAPYLDLFYGSLLIELCKLQPQSMPQVLAQATEILYERLDTMNTSCIERFVNWFAYHLSNFQFKWSWDDWSDCLIVDSEMPKPKFVRETLLKCLRLSYHQRITEIIPTSFDKLLPEKPIPHYKYEEEGAGSNPGTMVAHRLLQAVKSKCSPDDAMLIINELAPTSSNNPLKTDVLMQTLLFLGAKSFSHSFAAISKFHPVLKSLGEGRGMPAEDAQICILRSLHEIWKSHQQMLVVLTDKLLKTQVVECSAVAKWIFLPEMSEELTNFYIWEILHSTIKKMVRQVMKLQKEIEEMKDRMEENERKRKDGFDADDDDGDAADGGEIPSEDAITGKEEQLDELQSNQKNLFLIIFQRFIMILSEHLSQCEREGRDYNTPRYKWILERLQQVFLQHHEQVHKYVNTLENLVFTSDIDLHILKVFQQFCALRS